MPQLTSKDKIFIRVSRSFGGLSITVKTAPEVEEFFRGLGDGQSTTAVSTISRWWTPLGGLIPTNFRVYSIPEESTLLQPHDAPDGVRYRLDSPGGRLQRPDSNVINMSFLRLVGISGEEGIRFSVAGVYRDPEIDRFLKCFQSACSDFYRSYLKPIDRSMILSIEERTN